MMQFSYFFNNSYFIITSNMLNMMNKNVVALNNNITGRLHSNIQNVNMGHSVEPDNK